MKRLRHPITSIREPFGTAGLIVAMIALIAALGGTALAASKLNSTQKKEVEKIAKKFAGKNGPTGPAGPGGAAGKEGAAGAAGKNGASVTGKEGPEGKQGSPWTAGGILPKGSTEQGIWSVTVVETALHSIDGNSAISFGIPLPSPPTAGYVNESGEEALSFDSTTEEWTFGTPVNCLGASNIRKPRKAFSACTPRQK